MVLPGRGHRLAVGLRETAERAIRQRAATHVPEADFLADAALCPADTGSPELAERPSTVEGRDAAHLPRLHFDGLGGAR